MLYFVSQVFFLLHLLHLHLNFLVTENKLTQRIGLFFLYLQVISFWALNTLFTATFDPLSVLQRGGNCRVHYHAFACDFLTWVHDSLVHTYITFVMLVVFDKWYVFLVFFIMSRWVFQFRVHGEVIFFITVLSINHKIQTFKTNHLLTLYTSSTAYISSNKDWTLPPFPLSPFKDLFGIALHYPILFSYLICLSLNIVSN